MDDNNQHWITTVEAQEISGYHVNHVRRLIRENQVIGRKFGPIWQVDKQSFLDYLAKMESLGQKRGPKTGD